MKAALGCCVALAAASLSSAMHEFHAPSGGRTCPTANGCISPGSCVPPSMPHSAVATGPAPGLQWNINGGFCGAFSTQQSALAHGAYISQDFVRKSNRKQGGAHHMHGDALVNGFEVMPSNVKFTAQQLRLTSDEFDYMQPSPQAAAFKKWAKAHLVKKNPIAFFPMCKGDPHAPYPDSCPNGGHVDHVECMYGIFSNHSLDDTTVYDDDVILHTSDQDCRPYYRPMASLEDTPAMEGNCKHAEAGFGKNEMYPCIDQNVTYGLAVTGLAVNGTQGRTSVAVDFVYEPNVRSFEKPVTVHPTVTATGLKPGSEYKMLRYVGVASLPFGPPFTSPNASYAFKADKQGNGMWAAPGFSSHSAVYHFTVAK